MAPRRLPPHKRAVVALRLSLMMLMPGSIALSGCVHYAPRPVAPAALAARRAAAVLDMAAVTAQCHRIAPAAPCDPARWDQVMILAAVLAHNPDVAAAKAGIASAEAAARAARAPPGPTLTLSTEYAGAAPDPSPWLFGAGLAVPLDTGGLRRTRLASADLTVVLARYAWADAVWSARSAALRAVAERAAGVQQQGLARALIAVQERRLAALSRRVAEGLSARVEADRARNDLIDATRRAREAAARIDAARAALSAALGVNGDVIGAISLTDGRPDVSDALRQSAAVARTDVLRAVTAYDQSEIDLKSEVAKQYPQITVGPGFTWERGLVKIPFNLGLVLPPLDLNRRAIDVAEARRAEAAAKLEAVVAAAGAQIDAALLEARAARLALAQIETADIPLAQRLAAQADRELSAGLIDRTDWAVAKVGVFNAELSRIDAISRLKSADSALEDALRRPLWGPEAMITTVTP